MQITAVSKCTQKCRDLVDLSPYMRHLDHLVNLVRRLLCSAEWQPNSSRLKQRTLELLHLLLCRFGRCFGPCAYSLIPTLVALFGDENKDVRRLAILAVDQIGRCVSPATLFKHLLADCHIAHVKWQVRLHVLRAIVQCAILHMWAVDVTRAATAIYPLLWDDHQSVADMCVETVFVLHRVDPAANVVQLLSTLHNTHTTTHGSPSPDKRTAVWNRINRRLQTPCNASQPLITDPPITLLHAMLRGTVEGGGHREREVSSNESKLKHLRLRHRTPATRQRNKVCVSVVLWSCGGWMQCHKCIYGVCRCRFCLSIIFVFALLHFVNYETTLDKLKPKWLTSPPAHPRTPATRQTATCPHCAPPPHPWLWAAPTQSRPDTPSPKSNPPSTPLPSIPLPPPSICITSRTRL